MELDVWVVTRPSLTHRENEDRAVVGPEILAEVAGVEHRRLPLPTLLAAIDGLGGHSAGHVASQLSAKVLAAAEVPADPQSAASLVALADRTLHDAMQSDPELAGMGATVALSAIHDGGLITANAGDSTVWRYTDGQLEPLTVSDRIGGSRVGQCLGANAELSPHVQVFELSPGDRLLLASDGLTDVVDRGTIARILDGAIDAAVEQLLGMVEDARYPDDVTIVLAEVEPTEAS